MLRAVNDLCVLGAFIATGINMWRHLKNYRKPMDQRLIIRILCMVPVFAATSWSSLYAPRIAEVFAPIRDLYEGFVIYTFFALCTNLLGGERDIIYTATGRPPLQMVWPVSNFIESVDISDPYTFITIKRCIMQYVWLRPIITGLQVVFGDHVWLLCTLMYNVSLTITLNALTLFWICLLDDLKPYRALPKFLSIKLIVFFSYWQSLFLTILGYFKIIPTPELLNTIQGTLSCIETLIFAFVHWDAFPYTDYATTQLIGFARLPVFYAIRDAFGIRDLLYDFKCSFFGSRYGYREFDSVEAVLDHPSSRTRAARLAAGMRYKNGGRSKYWLPKGHTKPTESATGTGYGSTNEQEILQESAEETTSAIKDEPVQKIPWDKDDIDGDELFYTQARRIYGDYKYPTITVRESASYVPYAQRRSYT